jgi:hypothetical protein
LEGWELSGITLIASGTPFSVINGASTEGVDNKGNPVEISSLDNAGVANGLGAGSYPDVVGNPYAFPPLGGNNSLSFGPILGNPSAFVAPRGLTFGNAGRNFLNNPRRTNFDMTLAKHFKTSESTSLEFRAEAFNVFNHTQFRIYNPDIGNTGNNTVSCYAGTNNSAGASSCLLGSAFLHPVDAHRPRTLQLGLKLSF